MRYMDDLAKLEHHIEELWESRGTLEQENADALQPVEMVMDLLESGDLRVAEWDGLSEDVRVKIWVKHAILLLFKLRRTEAIHNGVFRYTDKIPLRKNPDLPGIRIVPGAVVRRGSYLGQDAVLMPSFVNIGAYVGEGTMVDTWATVGSCAQIGRHVHLAGGVGIGGVLEPPQAAPVMIGDEVFIGSRSMITQGAKVGPGAVLGEGTLLNPSIPVVDAETGDEISRGFVPPWCVALQAQRKKAYRGGEFYLPCVLVVRHLEPGERHDKAALESILREHGLGF
ncbi:MAG: 2,3,4,5-tetrahydropyridine-2,6-dicarboxylate N-succinyltransferase [Acidimicrobiales bacterium]